ncbi:hypothetical protein FACS1894188_07580 [Clostridia bacterium]|nr:hypothetical protein FACS1894188_07580 [Clostridia bacterium]
MKRVPKPYDTIYIVEKKICRYSGADKIVGEQMITKVGNKYFYADLTPRYPIAFEIDSFVDGSWADKTHDMGHPHVYWAFLSKSVYDIQMLKESRINEIKNANFEDMSCAKIERIYSAVFDLSDMCEAEDWEI